MSDVGHSGESLRLYQCPGCWSFGMHTSNADIECDCGQAMTLIDLRDRVVDSLHAVERATERFSDLTAGRQDRAALLADLGLGETAFYNTASRLSGQLHAVRAEHRDGDVLDRIVAADLMLFGLLLGIEFGARS